MSEFTSYPREDAFETTLSADIDASVTTVGLNTAPSFALASGKVYAVIDYDKPSTKFEVISFTGISGTNLTGVTRGVAKYDGGASTAQTHASGATVIISDNWQTWKDISTAIASKLDLAGGTITGNITMTGDLGLTGDINQTGDTAIDGALTITTPLAVAQGGTASTTAANARTALSAAESGANSDITSLSGLTTPLSVPQGGTGSATLASGEVLVGNGTSAPTTLAPGTASQVIISDGVDWTVDDPPIVGTAKALLSNINTTDGNNDAVARGSMVYGDSTPEWAALPIGAADAVITSDGTDVSWQTRLIPKYIVTGQTFTTGLPGATATRGNGYFDNTNECLYSRAASNILYKYYVSESKYVAGYEALFTNTRLDAFSNLYKDGSTWYWLCYSADAAAGWDRYTLDGTRSSMTMAGSTQSETQAPRTYDINSGLVYVLDDYTSTTVKIWSISGTTISNHTTATLTLSQAPTSTSQQNMHISGGYLYICGVAATGKYIDKYELSSGTYQSTKRYAYTSTNASYQHMIVEDYENQQYYVWSADTATPQIIALYQYSFF